MTSPVTDVISETTSAVHSNAKAHSQAWYRPTVSHEHGVYIVLLVSFLTGAALAQAGTLLAAI